VRVLFLAAEAAPLVKVGGLGDVVGSLPKALAALGHDARVAIPGYGAIDWLRHPAGLRATLRVPHSGGNQTAEIYETRPEGLPIYLVTGFPIPKDRRVYGSGIGEDGPKFIFFSLAGLWATQALGWKPDIVHAHDFHASAAIYWLATEGRRNEFFRSVASVLTIHNLVHTGEGAGRFLGAYGIAKSDSISFLPERFRDSLLALGILHAERLSAVSPTYAREILTPEHGHGLEGVLRARQEKLAGILNGIDTDLWNPAADSALVQTYDAKSLQRRTENKAALQEEAGLASEARAPLLAVVSRLDAQKGLDIALPLLSWWLERGGQFLLLGTGDPALEWEFALLERAYPGRASVRLRFDARFSRRIYAGADLLLIPSRYEPCGLTQMIAMRYGTVPVARRTGGLADTVTDVGEPGGTGIMFDQPNPGALGHALERALSVYADEGAWADLQRRGMEKDFSWERSARAYVALYQLALQDRNS